PLDRIPAALQDIASRAEEEVARTFRALARSWPKLKPDTLFHQGLKYVMAEPESADPNFVRTLLARVEEPAPQANSEPLFVMIEDALAAVSARLSLGTGGGCMMLLGPVRMRYPQALMVARGVAEAVSHSLSHDPNEAKQP
nr:hypothetical protein [Deinococcota bacterium]